MTAKEAIKQEAEECAKSATNQRNTPEDREIFHVLSIVLGGMADKIHSPHPEAVCDDCGGANVIWSAPSDVWNKVCRPNGEIVADPMLCPTCFAVRAKRAGLDVSWTLSPNAAISDCAGGNLKS
jgi:hypothetical protein